MSDDTAPGRLMDPNLRSLLQDQLERLREEEFQRKQDEDLIHKYIPRNIDGVPIYFPDWLRRDLAGDIRSIRRFDPVVRETVARILTEMGVTVPTCTPAVKIRMKRAIDEVERRQADDLVKTLLSHVDMTERQAQAYVARYSLKWKWWKVSKFMGIHHKTAQGHFAVAENIMESKHTNQKQAVRIQKPRRPPKTGHVWPPQNRPYKGRLKPAQ
jgi:hypothetical protein